MNLQKNTQTNIKINPKYTRKPLSNSSGILKSILGGIIVLCLCFGIFAIYSSFFVTKPSPTGDYTLEVKQGENLLTIGEKLSKDSVISQSLSLSILAQTREKFILQPKKYNLKLPANPTEILDQIESQSKIIAPIVNKKSIKLTIKEGDTVDTIISKLDQNKVAKSVELITIAQDYTTFYNSKYPFLPKPLTCGYSKTNCAKYYLEGYLYPDTYEFFEDSAPQDVFGKMLSNFDTKVWQKIPTDKKMNMEVFHKAVIMASAIEKETGRPIDGVNAENKAELIEEKKIMAGVFFNRLTENMKWESDPTGTYGTGKSLCQQTLKNQKDCLYLDSPEVQNKYNTYLNVGYPIGPITSPTVDSITAVLQPKENDFLLFVSDASGKKYFAKTNLEHEQNISKVQKINQQYRR